MKRKNPNATSVSEVAGNGLLDRRALLGRGMFFAGVAATGVGTANSAGAEALPVDPWSMEPGAPIPPYGVPAKYENKVVRTLTNPNNEPRTSKAARRIICSTAPSRRTACTSWWRAPAFPDIDPTKHRLVIHGLVKQPLVFDLEALARYPMVTRIHFVECGGNSAPLFNKDPVAGQRAGDPRPRVLLGMDRRAALDVARRDRHRSRRRSGCSRKAPTARA